MSVSVKSTVYFVRKIKFCIIVFWPAKLLFSLCNKCFKLCWFDGGATNSAMVFSLEFGVTGTAKMCAFSQYLKHSGLVTHPLNRITLARLKAGGVCHPNHYLNQCRLHWKSIKRLWEMSVKIESKSIFKMHLKNTVCRAILYRSQCIDIVITLKKQPGSAFIKPDQRNPWIKDQLRNALLSTILYLQLPNFVWCGRACPSHMTQNLVTVGAKL